MGTSNSVEELVGKISAYTDAIPAANRRAVIACADAVKASILPVMASATGGTMKLSGVGKKGVRIGVGSTPVTAGVNPSTIIYPRGPVWLLDLPVRRHDIAVRRTKRGRVRKGAAGALRFRDGTFAESAKDSGGGAERHTMQIGRDLVEPVLPAVFAAVHEQTLLSAFA